MQIESLLISKLEYKNFNQIKPIISMFNNINKIF